jgi:spermidine synthase
MSSSENKYEQLFWKLIKESGKNLKKVNKVRKKYKSKIEIKKIDSIFSSYYSKLFSKIESIFGKNVDEDDTGMNNFIHYLLSKGENNVKNILDIKSNKKIFTDVGKLITNITIKRTLFDKQSKYQHVQMFESKEFGNVLAIDNDINVTQLDEKNYHEMIVHVPMIYKLDAKKVLIIGGGDGGTARELLRYKNLDVTMVEIDEVVIEASKIFLPQTSVSFSNKRLNLIIGDGYKFIDEYNGDKFDVIIVDSTDFNQANKLFTNKFYKNIKKNLKPDGIFVFNNDSVFNDQLDLITKPVLQMKKLFINVFPYQLFIPTYNGGHYTMMFCSNTIHPLKTKFDNKRWCNLGLETEYYNIGVHLGSFFLPNNITKVLDNKLSSC